MRRRPRKTGIADHAGDTVEKRDHPNAPGRVAKQSERLREIRVLGIPAAEVLAEGDGWARHRLVEGPTLRQARALGLSEPQQAGLRALLAACEIAEVYVGDLNPRNLVWDGVQWVVIDCGALRELTATRLVQLRGMLGL